MKVKHYNEMMSYLTRPGFNGGGSVRNKTVLPKRKPKAEIKRRQKINYEKIKQYLEDESQEFIERELGFAVGGRVNPAQLKQRFMQLVASIPDADDAEIPGIVAQAKQIKDQIDEINKSLAPEKQIKIVSEGLEFDNPLLDAAKIAQTVGTTQEVTGGLTEDIVPESLTRKNPIYEGVPDYDVPGAIGVDEREKDDPKIDRRVGITPDRKFMQASMKMEGRRTSKNLRDYLRNIDLAATEGSFAEGGSVETPKRGLVDEPGSYSQPGEFKSLTKPDQKIYNLFKENKLTWTDKRLRERFVGKEWSKLSSEDRRAFRRSLPTVKEVISKTKNRIGINELLKITNDAFGEEINIKRLLGSGGGAETRGKLYQTPLGKQVKKLLKPKKIGDSQGSPTFYKRPTKEDLKIMRIAFKDARKLSNFLQSNTIKNVVALDKEFKSIFSKGQIPDIEDVIQRVDGINSPKAAATATMRLAQLYGGNNFNFLETIDPKLKNKFNSIRANKTVSDKMFKKLGEYDLMDPYRQAYYKISLDTIDDALGRKVGTFADFKKQAVAVLKAYKIPTTGKGAFNVNELVGVSGSAQSIAPEFSQFVNVIDEKMNQKTLRNYDSKLSILRQQIERNPKSKDLQKKIKKFNKFAINLEQEYDIGLAKIRPTKDVTKLFGKKRLAELKAQGIDIEKASKRAGYTIEIPRGTPTVQEFASLKSKRKTIDKVEGLKLLEKAGINVSQCFIRKGKAGGGRLEGETQQKCITRNINSEINKAKRSKDFSKFKNLKGFLKGTLAVDIPLELMFTMPHLISGDYEAAKRASTLGLFGYGGNAIDDFKDNPEVLKYVNTQNKTIEFVNQYMELDRLENDIQDRTKRYENPGNSPLFKQQLENDINYFTSEYNRIGSEYNNTLERFENKELGYDTIEDETKARKATQQVLEAQQKNLRGGFKPITNLEQAIEQNFSEYPRAVTKAQELIPQTPEGSPMLFDLGLPKDIRDSFGEIPLKYSSELGALEAKETREGLKRKQTEGILRSTGIPFADKIPKLFDLSKSFFRGYAGGGIAKLAGKSSGTPPTSGPNSGGLPSIRKNDMRIQE